MTSTPMTPLAGPRRTNAGQPQRAARVAQPAPTRPLNAPAGQGSYPQQDRRSGKGVRVCALESRPAAGAVLTSSLMIRHTERKAAGPVAHAGTGGTSGDSNA